MALSPRSFLFFLGIGAKSMIPKFFPKIHFRSLFSQLHCSTFLSKTLILFRSITSNRVAVSRTIEPKRTIQGKDFRKDDRHSRWGQLKKLPSGIINRHGRAFGRSEVVVVVEGKIGIRGFFLPLLYVFSQSPLSPPPKTRRHLYISLLPIY